MPGNGRAHSRGEVAAAIPILPSASCHWFNLNIFYTMLMARIVLIASLFPFLHRLSFLPSPPCPPPLPSLGVQDGSVISAGGPYSTHAFTFDHVYDVSASQKKVSDAF